MRSAYVYFPILSSCEDMRRDVSNISGDFIQMKNVLRKVKALGFKGVLLAPVFEAFEYDGISPYMPKSDSLDSALISPGWIYDKYEQYLSKSEKFTKDPSFLNHTSVWKKRRYIREMIENLKAGCKGSELDFEFSVFKKTRYDKMIYAALQSEFPRFLASKRLKAGKDAEYWHFNTLLEGKLREKFDSYYFSGASATWPEDFFTMPKVRAYYENLLKDEINNYIFEQFIAEKQFVELMSMANELNLTLIFDIPIGVCEDSSFVIESRMERKNYYYEKDGLATYTIGTPDSNWGIIAYQNNSETLNHILERYDKLARLGARAFRIDAILQLVDSWIIERDKSGYQGKSQRFDGYEFFRRLREKYPDALLVSEDLSSVEMPREVRDIQKSFNVYGMGLFTYMEDNHFENDLMRMNSKGVNVVIHTTNHDTGSLVSYAKRRWNDIGYRYTGIKNFVMDSIWRVLSCQNEYVIINILDLMMSDESFQTEDSSRWTVRINLDEMDMEIKSWIERDALRLTNRM